jgi:hypothetical protein
MVVTWSSYAQDGSGLGVYARRYPSPLAAPGPEVQVNTYTTFSQLQPAVAVDSAGNLVVVWTSDHDPGGYSVVGACAVPRRSVCSSAV